MSWTWQETMCWTCSFGRSLELAVVELAAGLAVAVLSHVEYSVRAGRLATITPGGNKKTWLELPQSQLLMP